VDRMSRSNQFGTARCIDAVEAWRNRRRATDSKVHFARAGCLDHLHNLPARGAAHEPIIEENHTLPFEDAADRIQLHLDAEVPDRLLRLNECPPDVMIADEA